MQRGAITTAWPTQARQVEAEGPHCECGLTRRWRWLPWPKVEAESWWTFITYPDRPGASFVAADSRAELDRLIPEHVRFFYGDPDYVPVLWMWKAEPGGEG